MAEPVPLVRVQALRHVYRRSGQRVVALDGVNFSLAAGSILALVGASGSGKSTLGRCLAGLEKPSGGTIELAGEAVAVGGGGRRTRWRRRRVQLVHQEPAAALNPRFTAAEAVAEPLIVARQGLRTRAGLDREVRRAEQQLVRERLAEVGLDAAMGARRVGALSGGQRRRLVLARALAAAPRLLVLDEVLAGLDLGLQAQMVNLLLSLKARHGLTFLFISHDLRLAAYLAEEVAVLDGGRLVEHASAAALLSRPLHPASRALVDAMLPALPGAPP